MSSLHGNVSSQLHQVNGQWSSEAFVKPQIFLVTPIIYLPPQMEWAVKREPWRRNTSQPTSGECPQFKQGLNQNNQQLLLGPKTKSKSQLGSLYFISMI